MIIEMEKQVMSFEISKRLKEIGIRQDTVYKWSYQCDYCVLKQSYMSTFPVIYGNEFTRMQIIYFIEYAAYTVAELLTFFPEKIIDKGRVCKLTIMKTNRGIMVNYLEEDFHIQMLQWIFDKDDNLANCLATLIFELIKNGHIKAEDL